MKRIWRFARVKIHIVGIRMRRILAVKERIKRRKLAESILPVNQDFTVKNLGKLIEEGFSLCDLEEKKILDLLSTWEILKNKYTDNNETVKSLGKDFFKEMLTIDDFINFPIYLDIALDEKVLNSVLTTMGLIPHLESIDILYSLPTGELLQASQLWHKDVNDERIVKLFIYLEDCSKENGPFTFIPAKFSQNISSRLGHYVTDKKIVESISKSEWRMVEGVAGTAFLIDTGRCYHFGSRCLEPRVALVITYSSGLKFMEKSRVWEGLMDDSKLTPLQRKVSGHEL